MSLCTVKLEILSVQVQSTINYLHRKRVLRTIKILRLVTVEIWTARF